MAVHRARQLGLENFSILCSHVLVPPAMEALWRYVGSMREAAVAGEQLPRICQPDSSEFGPQNEETSSGTRSTSCPISVGTYVPNGVGLDTIPADCR